MVKNKRKINMGEFIDFFENKDYRRVNMIYVNGLIDLFLPLMDKDYNFEDDNLILYGSDDTEIIIKLENSKIYMYEEGKAISIDSGNDKVILDFMF